MLKAELRELENTQEKLNRDKTVSKVAIRKLVKRAFIWMPIFMILVNYVRNGIDPFIFIYTPVFLFYTAIYTGSHCLIHLDLQYSRQTLFANQEGISGRTGFL